MNTDSTKMTLNLKAQILGTNNNQGKTRGEIKAERKKRNQQKLRQFLATYKKRMETLNQKGIWNWLTNLPIKELRYELTKQEFWDAIKIRYI